jgi:hypothetical protein
MPFAGIDSETIAHDIPSLILRYLDKLQESKIIGSFSKIVQHDILHYEVEIEPSSFTNLYFFRNRTKYDPESHRISRTTIRIALDRGVFLFASDIVPMSVTFVVNGKILAKELV